VLSLPISPVMTDEQVQTVIEAVNSFSLVSWMWKRDEPVSDIFK
jgi:hypothetical protein